VYRTTTVITSFVIAACVVAGPARADNAAKAAHKPAHAAAVQDEVVAHTFRLVNKAGRTTMLIRSGDDDKSPTILLYGANGQRRVAITVNEGSTPIVALYSDKGKLRMIVGPSGHDDSPAISLIDSADKQRALVAVIKDQPVIAVYRKDGTPGAGIEVDNDLANVTAVSGDNKISMFAKGTGEVATSFINGETTKGLFGMNADGSLPILTVGGGHGEEGITLAAVHPGPYIGISDSNVFRTKLSVTAPGDGRLDFFDAKGVNTIAVP